MQIRNDKNRINANIEIGQIVYISSVKYVVYAITENSIKIESNDAKIPNGLKRKDFYNKNTFAKRYFFDKVKQIWIGLQLGRGVNMDYI